MSPFMCNLNLGNQFKPNSQFLEAFFSCFAGHMGMHIDPPVVLACCRVSQILLRNADVVQLLESYLGMFFFLARGPQI